MRLDTCSKKYFGHTAGSKNQLLVGDIFKKRFGHEQGKGHFNFTRQGMGSPTPFEKDSDLAKSTLFQLKSNLDRSCNPAITDIQPAAQTSKSAKRATIGIRHLDITEYPELFRKTIKNYTETDYERLYKKLVETWA